MYNGVNKFWFWAHKVLPLTYDDSLSYYEFLCKVLTKMNECIDKINELGTELDNFETWTRDEFDAVRNELAQAVAELEHAIETEIARVDGRIDDAEHRLDTAEGDIDILQDQMLTTFQTLLHS